MFGKETKPKGVGGAGGGVFISRAKVKENLNPNLNTNCTFKASFLSTSSHFYPLKRNELHPCLRRHTFVSIFVLLWQSNFSVFSNWLPNDCVSCLSCIVRHDRNEGLVVSVYCSGTEY